MKYCLAIKKNKLLIDPRTWMEIQKHYVFGLRIQSFDSIYMKTKQAQQVIGGCLWWIWRGPKCTFWGFEIVYSLIEVVVIWICIFIKTLDCALKVYVFHHMQIFPQLKNRLMWHILVWLRRPFSSSSIIHVLRNGLMS